MALLVLCYMARPGLTSGDNLDSFLEDLEGGFKLASNGNSEEHNTVPLAGLTDDQLQGYESILLERVPQQGGVGNSTLRTQLGWDETLYWSIRDRLIDRGILELGRGRGGSVKRASQTPEAPPAAVVSSPVTPTDPCAEELTEESLYGPLATVLQTQWVKDRRYDQYVVEITARQGARNTGGRWTRPDIVIASLTTYPYVPGKHFDVTTFEVKRHEFMDVTAVYEALAHLRSATQVYVLLYVPDELVVSYEDTLEIICEEAERHGVGVLVVGSASNYATWDLRIEPRRREPNPEKLNDFLAKQTSTHFKEQIVKWFR